MRQSIFNTVGIIGVISFFWDICRTDPHPLGLCDFPTQQLSGVLLRSVYRYQAEVAEEHLVMGSQMAPPAAWAAHQKLLTLAVHYLTFNPLLPSL